MVCDPHYLDKMNATGYIFGSSFSQTPVLYANYLLLFITLLTIGLF